MDKEKVERYNNVIKSLIDAANQIPGCTSLSAPYIGSSEKICIIKQRNNQWRGFIEPVIAKFPGNKPRKVKVLEKCILTGETFEKSRYEKIYIIFKNEKNQILKKCFVKEEAYRLLHELDHLAEKVCKGD